MPNLPNPVAAYFASDPQADEAALARFLAAEAIVRDEGREHRGLAAIRNWRLDVMARTPFTAEPLSVEDRGDVVVVPARVSGAFPGSPITLDHRFTLRDGHIAMLEIG